MPSCTRSWRLASFLERWFKKQSGSGRDVSQPAAQDLRASDRWLAAVDRSSIEHAYTSFRAGLAMRLLWRRVEEESEHEETVGTLGGMGLKSTTHFLDAGGATGLNSIWSQYGNRLPAPEGLYAFNSLRPHQVHRPPTDEAHHHRSTTTS